MRKPKYSKEHLNNLIEAAQRFEIKDPNIILNNLYYISANGMVDRYRELIYNNLANEEYKTSMLDIENIQSLVSDDCKAFDTQPLESKERFFRISNLIDVDPNNYNQHETTLKSLGSVNTSHYREAAKSLEIVGESKSYALLTYTVRKRFEKRYEEQLKRINKFVRNNQKIENNKPEEPKRKTKLKI